MQRKNLTIKQKRYSENIIINMAKGGTKRGKKQSNTQAAIDAGYSAKSAVKIATENQTKPAIIAEIAKGIAKLEAKTGITVQFIQDLHLQALDRLIGNDETNYKGHLEGLGKTVAAYRDGLDISQQQQPQEFSAAEREELRIAAAQAINIKLRAG